MKLHGLNWLMVLMWWAGQTPRQMVDLCARLYLAVISKVGVPLRAEQNHSSRDWGRPPQVNLSMTWNTHKGLLIFSTQCHSPLCLCHLEKLPAKCWNMSSQERIQLPTQVKWKRNVSWGWFLTNGNALVVPWNAMLLINFPLFIWWEKDRHRFFSSSSSFFSYLLSSLCSSMGMNHKLYWLCNKIKTYLEKSDIFN